MKNLMMAAAGWLASYFALNDNFGGGKVKCTSMESPRWMRTETTLFEGRDRWMHDGPVPLNKFSA